MTRQILFSEEKFFKYLASKRVRNILGIVVGKTLEQKYNTEKVIIPIVCDKERAGDDCILLDKTNLLSDKTNFKIKYQQKGKTIIQNNKLEGEKKIMLGYICTKKYTQRYPQNFQTVRQNRQVEGWTH